ncbi:MAG: MBL fold metallo-hydrolase [Deltaproteobacteria bacterium]|nr:MBL fold metallo-hydrolase [Deltaproteobacteria bacterium]MBT8481524.1 MBL fold metallo-hydrolase [Deltaproteobacteria bacterium]NNL24386.1 MBL fold metallo-hydrolase [Myxococcales bacterium]
MARAHSSSSRIIAFVAMTLVSSAAASPLDDTLGPAPREEGGRFMNFAGAMPEVDASVTLPFFVRRVASSFAEIPSALDRVPNDGAWLRENATHSEPTVTWIGHATLLVQMGHLTFLTDPIWSDRASPVSFAGPKRIVEPGVAIGDLPPIDFVVVSHNHYDHLDLPSLVTLSERDPNTRFYVPLENGDLLRENGIDNVEELDWGQHAEHEGVRVYCLPAQHWSKRGIGDDREALWSSWAVVGAERKFFFAGDTGYFDGFTRIAKALGPFDLAAVPIGAYEPTEMMKASHMNPEEAVQAAIDLRARAAVAMHYGTFKLSDEPLDEPATRFKNAASEGALGNEAAWLLQIGETRAF